MSKRAFPPHASKRTKEEPIPEVYTAVDSDLARDNLENDLPFADREDIRHARHP